MSWDPARRWLAVRVSFSRPEPDGELGWRVSKAERKNVTAPSMSCHVIARLSLRVENIRTVLSGLNTPLERHPETNRDAFFIRSLQLPFPSRRFLRPRVVLRARRFFLFLALLFLFLLLGRLLRLLARRRWLFCRRRRRTLLLALGLRRRPRRALGIHPLRTIRFRGRLPVGWRRRRTVRLRCGLRRTILLIGPVLRRRVLFSWRRLPIFWPTGFRRRRTIWLRRRWTIVRSRAIRLARGLAILLRRHWTARLLRRRTIGFLLSGWPIGLRRWLLIRC